MKFGPRAIGKLSAYECLKVLYDTDKGYLPENMQKDIANALADIPSPTSSHINDLLKLAVDYLNRKICPPYTFYGFNPFYGKDGEHDFGVWVDREQIKIDEINGKLPTIDELGDLYQFRGEIVLHKCKPGYVDLYDSNGKLLWSGVGEYYGRYHLTRKRNIFMHKLVSRMMQESFAKWEIRNSIKQRKIIAPETWPISKCIRKRASQQLR